MEISDVQEILASIKAEVAKTVVGYEDVVDILLAAGADADRVDAKGMTALKLAHDKGRAAIAEMLQASNL
ncbi:ankyrin repeat domain-containing protein [Candidatus Bathyarchaeota archaeon]|nr:ankyrin repeat domain-containing protein [Candidatus Bathyarchaeota archaeon]